MLGAIHPVQAGLSLLPTELDARHLHLVQEHVQHFVHGCPAQHAPPLALAADRPHRIQRHGGNPMRQVQAHFRIGVAV